MAADFEIDREEGNEQNIRSPIDALYDAYTAIVTAAQEACEPVTLGLATRQSLPLFVWM